MYFEHWLLALPLNQLKEAAYSEEETNAAELRKKLSDTEMECQVCVFSMYIDYRVSKILANGISLSDI